jgi:hypothetical protein
VPPDNAAFGFDNISDALGLSPTLQERYLAAADASARWPWVTGRSSPRRTPTRFARTCRRIGTSTVCHWARWAARSFAHTFPLDGEYDVQVKLYRSNLGMMRGLQSAAPLRVAIDGRPCARGHGGRARRFWTRRSSSRPTRATPSTRA